MLPDISVTIAFPNSKLLSGDPAIRAAHSTEPADEYLATKTSPYGLENGSVAPLVPFALYRVNALS